jgi:ankyrin repeat protein
MENLEQLQKLRDEGADLNAVDYLGRSPLHVLASTGSKKIATYLLSQDLDLDMVDNKGRSALFLALEAGFIELSTMLLEKGAQVIADNERIAHLLCNSG